MGNCCVPPCDQDPLSLSIDRKDSVGDFSKVIIPKVSLEKSLIESSNSKKAFRKSLENSQKSIKILVLQPETAEFTKNEIRSRNLTESNQFKCSCGSTYSWKVDLVLQNYLKSGSWKILCSDCSCIFSSPGWLCGNCDSKLCPACSALLCYSIPEIKCENQHNLEFSIENVMYRHEKFNKKTFKCNMCEVEKIEECFTCSACDYYLCIECANSLGVNVRPSVQCYGKHSLEYKFRDQANDFCQCSLCFEDGIKDRVECEECEFIACFNCVVQSFNDKLVHPGIMCKKKHLFQLQSIKRLRKHKEKWIYCLMCDKANMKYAYGCKSCEDCICLECLRNLVGIIRRFTSSLCPKGHKYLWNPANEPLKPTCQYCQNSLNFSGFFCGICNHSVCYECIQYPNSFASRGSNLSLSYITNN